MTKFTHFRAPSYHVELGKALVTDGINSRGGATVAYLEQEGKLYAAVAYCNPTDNFCYKYGRNKAQGRLTQLTYKPELNDSDKYFILDPATGLETLHKFMTDDMGYIHRGQRKKEKAEAAAAA